MAIPWPQWVYKSIHIHMHLNIWPSMQRESFPNETIHSVDHFPLSRPAYFFWICLIILKYLIHRCIVNRVFKKNLVFLMDKGNPTHPLFNENNNLCRFGCISTKGKEQIGLNITELIAACWFNLEMGTFHKIFPKPIFKIISY
jgi:hypothetical protein